MRLCASEMLLLGSRSAWLTLLGLGKAGLRVGDCLGWGDCRRGGRSGPRHEAHRRSCPAPSTPGTSGAPLPTAPLSHGLLPHPCLAACPAGSRGDGAPHSPPPCSAPMLRGSGAWSMSYSGGCKARVGGGWPGCCPAPLPLTCAPLLCRGLIHLLTHMAEALRQARLLVFLVIPPAVAPG